MTKQCAVCGSETDLKYFPTSGYSKNAESEVFYSGGFHLCKECLSICETCTKCNKLKPSLAMEHLFSGIMKSFAFCDCYEDDNEKNLRYDRENKRYNQLQTKKKMQEMELAIKKEENRKIAKPKEKQLHHIEPFEIKEFICCFEKGDYILDTFLSNIFRITTQKLRKIIQTNISAFTEEELYQISDEELNAVETEFENFVTTINPYAINIFGIIKLSAYINNDISKQFMHDVSKCLLENKLFSTKDENLQALYDALTDNYYYKTIKGKPEKIKNTIKDLKDELNLFKTENNTLREEITSLHGSIVFIIGIAITIIVSILR